MQVLRPVIENFLVSLYFEFLGENDAFKKWVKGTYKIPLALYQKICGEKEKPKRKILRSKIENWVEEEIIRPLNNYLHPHFPSFEISEKWGEHSNCPAAVKYDEKKLNEWLDIYQKTVWFMLEALFEFFGYEFFERDESAREGLDF
ncbi:MAG: hypothetical protein J7L07_04235 [Candidatus Odinarchaeota archaeon]|nr:hypothetical protein [Candidatus Odinarchaeota archaeon]